MLVREALHIFTNVHVWVGWDYKKCVFAERQVHSYNHTVLQQQNCRDCVTWWPTRRMRVKCIIRYESFFFAFGACSASAAPLAGLQVSQLSQNRRIRRLAIIIRGARKNLASISVSSRILLLYYLSDLGCLAWMSLVLFIQKLVRSSHNLPVNPRLWG